MKKNAMLQIMRIVFCLVIVQFHFRGFNYGVPMPTGYLATDYFFIISGYLMMANAAKQEAGPGSVLDDTRRYIFHKFGKMLPYYVASYVVVFLARLVFQGCSFAKARTLLMSSLSELFLVGGSGLYEFYMNGAVWFLSVLFLGSLLLYPVCRKLQRSFSCLLAPLFALFALGYLDAHFHQYSFARYPYGLIRGTADLCIGCSAFGFFQSGWQTRLLEGPGRGTVIFKRSVFSLFEIGMYLAAILCMHSFPKGDTDYLTIIFLSIGIAISVSGLSYTAQIPSDGKWFGLASTGTLVVFLSHEYWPMAGGVFQNSPAKNYFLALGFVAATTAIVWAVGGSVKNRGGIFAASLPCWGYA